MAFMKDILTHNIPIWEECAATPFVQEVQTGKLPLEKFKRYMIQDSIYLKNYARIYGKAIFHAATLREIQLYYSMLNFVNDTESEVRLDYLKQFYITDDDIELIAPCGLDLKDRCGAIRQFHKVVHISQHPRILWVLEHLFDLVDPISGFPLEYLCYQRLQQMPHFHGNPVALIIFH